MLTRRGLGTVLRDLAQMGYDAEWGVLGARHVGAKHRRMRIWILAHPKRDEQPWKKSCSRTLGRVGREKQSVERNTNWEEVLSTIRGASHGIPNRVDRTDAIRNAQVPAVAELAWRLLKSIEYIDEVIPLCKCTKTVINND
jgi:DNA (cytosine-5)-methyltransferase 1